MDDNVARLDAANYGFRQGLSTSSDFAKQLCTRKFVYGSVYSEKFFKGMSVEKLEVSIIASTWHWRAEHQDVSPNDHTRKTEFVIDSQGIPT